MADVRELDDVSSAIMCMDTLAMDSMHMPRNVEAPGAQSKVGSNTDSDAADVALRTHSSSPSFQEVFPEDEHELEDTKDMNMDVVENDLEEEIVSDDDDGLMTDPGTPDTPGTPQGVDDLDETIDMHVDGTEDDLEKEEDEEEEEEEQGSDYKAPAARSLEEAPEDVHVVGAEEEKESVVVNEKLSAPFPISRVKKIIKLDKDVRLVTSDAINLVAHATALFVQSLSSASFTVMLQTKRKTIRGPDVVLAATSTRQFRECLGNDLAILLETSNEDELVEKEQGEKPQQRKSAKKHQLAPPPGRQPITNFFKSSI